MSSSTGSVISPLQRLRQGDENTFAELFEEHRDRLHRIIAVRLDARLAQRVDVDDILQEVYLDAADRISYYIENHSESLLVWLRLVTMQTMANVFRRHFDAKMRDARMEVSLESCSHGKNHKPVLLSLLGQLTSPSAAAMRDETAKQLTDLIANMKPMDREIIHLRHFEMLDNREVAEVLGIQQKAASIRYVRAIQRLRQMMDNIPGLVDVQRDNR